MIIRVIKSIKESLEVIPPQLLTIFIENHNIGTRSMTTMTTMTTITTMTTMTTIATITTMTTVSTRTTETAI